MTIDTFTAISINGIACEEFLGGSRIFQKISDLEILNFRNKIRNHYDAILVGANTILVDNPDLLNPKRTNKRVIIDVHNNFPFHLKIFVNKPENTLLITKYRKEKKNYYKDLLSLGVKVLFVNVLDDLNKIIQELKKLKLNSILVEGGPKTINNFLKTNLVSNFQVVVFPVLISRSGRNLYEGIKNYSLKLIESKIIKKKYLFMRYSI